MALLLLLEVPWGVTADKIGCRREMIFCSWLYFLSDWNLSAAFFFGAGICMVSLVFFAVWYMHSGKKTGTV